MRGVTPPHFMPCPLSRVRAVRNETSSVQATISDPDNPLQQRHRQRPNTLPSLCSLHSTQNNLAYRIYSTTSNMNRLFGSKPTGPKPTLNGAISNLDTRISSLDTKLKALNAELGAYQEKLSRMREGPGKQAMKQKALKVLQRRKAYEAEKDKLESQVWNMEQASNMQDNLKNVMTQVDAMKTTNKELKKQYGKIDIDKIERLQDEMADLMDVGNEIQESLARSYDIPEDVEEDELDAELEALGMEVEMEHEMGGAVPGFLQDEVVPEFVDEPPQTEDKVKQVAG
ncbi:hypothetical protein F53441_10425 [Fusarium austroafricanum]|uniref:Charged multivesicular body protein 5 n=1 Tax=Fusarium austroafricanum TaxID=2364996 RepID=A0A8H4K9N6_9HYPO|nr:hypothetical protein F53441_10425 [Fusarium austroafricanum]